MMPGIFFYAYTKVHRDARGLAPAISTLPEDARGLAPAISTLPYP